MENQEQVRLQPSEGFDAFKDSAPEIVQVPAIQADEKQREYQEKRKLAARKAATTRKQKRAGAKAANTRKRREAGRKAAKTRKLRQAGRKAAETRRRNRQKQ